MSLIRPELAARLSRHRELLSALALAGFGGWVFARGGWFYGAIGAAVIAVAAIWARDAWRRERFARAVAAPGLVEQDEGVVRVLSARALGGQIALNDLAELRLLRLKGHPHWRLKSRGGEALLIPLDAAGAERLAGSFAALPGFDMGKAVAAIDAAQAGGDAVQVIWRRPAGG